MLVSLKAGNSGLNLTAASQVIILDPHWNGYVEAQAVDRAYRIGQQRPVEVHRILIDHQGFTPDGNGHTTVEDRILALQEKKRELVETALDETAGRSIARLGVRELGFLFVSHQHTILTFPSDFSPGSQSNGVSKRSAITNIENPTCYLPSCLMVWCVVR
jgi:SNF2 family DNA or RNA helicase